MCEDQELRDQSAKMDQEPISARPLHQMVQHQISHDCLGN